MISNFEKHLNIRLLESQLKMSANNRIPICEGEDCDFLVDDEDPMYEQYFYLFKLVNEKDVDSFANKVK